MKKRSKSPKTIDFSPVVLRADILRESRALNISTGFAEQISESVAKKIESYLSAHPIVTDLELSSLIEKEIGKFNADLAYIYHNRDKII